MLINVGFKGGDFPNFLQLGIPDKALAIIIEYYTFEAEENCTELAKAAYRSFAAIGIRTWVQSELGYQKQPVRIYSELAESLDLDQLRLLEACSMMCEEDDWDDIKAVLSGYVPEEFWGLLDAGKEEFNWLMQKRMQEFNLRIAKIARKVYFGRLAKEQNSGSPAYMG